MAKEVISVDGEDQVVREDTAKSYRGVVWALTSVAIFVAILALVFFLFLGKSLFEGDMKSPSQIESETRR